MSTKYTPPTNEELEKIKAELAGVKGLNDLDDVIEFDRMTGPTSVPHQPQAQEVPAAGWPVRHRRSRDARVQSSTRRTGQLRGPAG